MLKWVSVLCAALKIVAAAVTQLYRDLKAVAQVEEAFRFEAEAARDRLEEVMDTYGTH